MKSMPEGPFGDHLGYYSLRHDFPVMRVEKVYHRDRAISGPSRSSAGRRQNTIFGQLIHHYSVSPRQLPGCTPCMPWTPSRRPPFA